MNSNCISILTNPHPRSHIVYPYTDEVHVTEAVCLFAGGGLCNDEAVILVMAKPHFAPILQRLEAAGFDNHALQGCGQLACIDAEELLRRFMLDGMPDATLFKNAMGVTIHRAQASGAAGHGRTVRIFGEMVSLLWADSITAAERLEQLWNEVIETYSVSVLCTYALGGGAAKAVPQSIAGQHTHHLAVAV